MARTATAASHLSSALAGLIANLVPAAPGDADWRACDPWIRLGRRIVLWLLGGLLITGFVVSISGAVVAPGQVIVASNNKAVQHLEGGIVTDIRVANGDRVGRGDVLLRLDDTAARANLAVVRARLIDATIQEARLETERDGGTRFELSGPLAELGRDDDVDKVYRAQRTLFQARHASRTGTRAMLEARIEQSDAELKGLRAQHSARSRERELVLAELKTLRPLFQKGYTSQQRVGAMERDAARLDGEVGRLASEIGRATSAMAEARLKLVQSEKDFVEGVVDELRKVQAQIAELRESRTALKDRLERTEIRAPNAGRVHALAAHTEGGVIAPGTQIMQIVPDGERLVVETLVPPQDIDKVRTGLTATVRFTAFNARTTPQVTGRVAKVSAAQLTDSQGRTYFTALIDIPVEELDRIGGARRLLPGMPAEVFIETGARSILSYVLRPLEDAVMRAFRET